MSGRTTEWNLSALLGKGLPVLIDIFETQHLDQPGFMVLGKAAAFGEAVGVFEGAEHAIPPGDVAEVVLVYAKLVMDRVMLRALNKPAEPFWCADIGVIKILAKRAEEGGPGACFCATAEQTVNKETGEDRVGGNFDGVLVKGG